MYTQFFRLKQSPFSIAPDPRYLFMSARHREALAHLLYGINKGGGVVLLTGEVGAGKTTVCRCFIEQVPANCRLAYIFNPKLSVGELLQSICEEFRVPLPPALPGESGVKRYVDSINGYLLASHARRHNNVLIIDEAQNLSVDVLEQLRLLTNLETSERKLLQIILIGQPELRGILARPEMEQLAQRVLARYHLGSLTVAETSSYIKHRLLVAGATGFSPFPRGVLPQIQRLSKGIPRRINLLCDRALLGAYVENSAQVTPLIVSKAAAEVFAGESSSAVAMVKPKMLYAAAGLLAGVAITAAAAWNLLPRSAPALHSEPASHNAAGAAVARPAPVAGATPPAVTAVAPSVAAAAPAVVTPAPAVAKPVAATAAPVAAGSATVPASARPAPAPALLPAAIQGTGSVAAMRELASLWGQTLPEGDACTVIDRFDMRCFTGKGGLYELRHLARPAMLTLRGDVTPDAPKGVSYALLTHLTDDSATLRVAGKEQTVSLAALTARFDGEFTTLWRVPRGWRETLAPGARGVEIDWLAQRLAQLNSLPAPHEGKPLDPTMQRLLRQFQVSHGLKADGMAGPKTYIRLAPPDGKTEPQLQKAAPAAVAMAGK